VLHLANQRLRPHRASHMCPLTLPWLNFVFLSSIRSSIMTYFRFLVSGLCLWICIYWSIVSFLFPFCLHLPTFDLDSVLLTWARKGASALIFSFVRILHSQSSLLSIRKKKKGEILIFILLFIYFFPLCICHINLNQIQTQIHDLLGSVMLVSSILLRCKLASFEFVLFP